MRRAVGIGQVCQLSQQCLYIVPLGVHALGGMSAAEIRGTNGGTQCLDVAAEHDLGPGLKTQVYVVAWGNQLLELGGARHIRSIDADEGHEQDGHNIGWNEEYNAEWESNLFQIGLIHVKIILETKVIETH